MPQNVASDQGLHCLHLIKEFLYSIVIRINKTTQTLLSLGSGPVQKVEDSTRHKWFKTGLSILCCIIYSSSVLRVIGTLLGEVSGSKLICLSSEKESTRLFKCIGNFTTPQKNDFFI